MGFFTRIFTPSKSDNQSGAEYNAAYTAASTLQTAQAAPRTPEPDSAAAMAAAEVERKRRMRLLAGGNTVLASGNKATLEGTTGSAPKTLLGS